MKDTAHELLIVIANQGYNEMVMAAAKERRGCGRHCTPRQGNRHEESGEILRGFPLSPRRS